MKKDWSLLKKLIWLKALQKKKQSSMVEHPEMVMLETSEGQQKNFL